MPDEVREMRDRVQAGGENTFPVKIDYTSVDGVTYQGILHFKVPTAREMIRHGVLVAKYLQQDFASGEVDYKLIPDYIKDLAEALVNIDLFMDKKTAPDWALKLAESPDSDVAVVIYRRFVYEKAAFRGAGKKPAEAGGGTPK